MLNLLLAHVMEPCDDPDCEIHNIAVGLSEGTVTQVELAFFIAGAQAMEVRVRREFRRLEDEELEPIPRLIAACRAAGFSILKLADRYRREAGLGS